MNCNEAVYLLFNLREETEPAARIEEFKRHLAVCSACRLLKDYARQLRLRSSAELQEAICSEAYQTV